MPLKKKFFYEVKLYQVTPLCVMTSASRLGLNTNSRNRFMLQAAAVSGLQVS
jgi:hypothetical protein